MKNTILYLIIGLLVAGIIVSNLYQCNSSSNKEDLSTKLINALEDTVTHYKNDKGQDVARISMLETESAKQFLNIKSKDSVIIELQNAVKHYKGKADAVVIFDSNTEMEGKTVTIVETINNYPVYKSLHSNDWLKLSINADKDSTSYDLSLYNKFQIGIGKEKGVSFVEVTDLNPYSKTGTVRGFQLTETKQNKFNFGIQAGYGLLFDIRHDRLSHGAYVGLGATYTFFGF